MNLCVGFAILGLCFPLPGQSRTAIEAAGWRVFDKSQHNWSASSVFSAGTVRVSALVTGHGALVTSLFVLELPGDNDSPRSVALATRLAEVCRGESSIRDCAIAELKFKAIECAGGWVMVSPSTEPAKVATECRNHEALFLDAVRSRTPTSRNGATSTVELSGDAIIAFRLALADFESVVEASHDAGLVRPLEDYRATLMFRDGGIEIEFVGKVDDVVGGGARYFAKPPYATIEKRQLFK